MFLGGAGVGWRGRVENKCFVNKFVEEIMLTMNSNLFARQSYLESMSICRVFLNLNPA